MNHFSRFQIKKDEVIKMTLKKNVGNIDSIIRVVLGALAVGFGFYYGGYWLLLGVVGLILVSTGTLSFCPFYRLMKISTMNPNLEREN